MTLKKLKDKLIMLLSVPKSFYVSYRLCGLKCAMCLPIKVRYNTVLRSLSGKVILDKPRTGAIRIGLGPGEGTVDRRFVRGVLEIEGTIHVKNYIVLACAPKLFVGSNGLLEVDSMHNTSRIHIVCTRKITIGSFLSVGWGATIMDSDMHETINLETGKINCDSKEIVIGNNVWLGTDSLVLKGAVIPDGCILGAKSVTSKKFNERNSVIVDNPAIVVRNNITRYYHDRDDHIGYLYVMEELKKCKKTNY